jgi:hypothetical protein
MYLEVVTSLRAEEGCRKSMCQDPCSKTNNGTKVQFQDKTNGGQYVIPLIFSLPLMSVSINFVLLNETDKFIGES